VWLIAAAVALVGGVLLRRRTIAYFERECAGRLPLGTDGVVAGAAPIVLSADGPRAVLILHGFGDTPQTVRYLADFLRGRGLTVRAPLLPGHGRSLREFASTRADDWVAAARQELETLQASYDEVAIIGLSMGGALASVLAAARAELPALVLLAPYISMPRRLRHLARIHWLWAPLVPYIAGRGERSIHDERERAGSRAYGIVPGRSLYELLRLSRRGFAALARVQAPTLMVQSREDNRIPPDAAKRIFDAIGAGEKELVWLEGCGHIITVDFGRERVFELVERWLGAHWRHRPALTA
jgi:carboxylesterase